MIAVYPKVEPWDDESEEETEEQVKSRPCSRIDLVACMDFFLDSRGVKPKLIDKVRLGYLGHTTCIRMHASGPPKHPIVPPTDALRGPSRFQRKCTENAEPRRSRSRNGKS